MPDQSDQESKPLDLSKQDLTEISTALEQRNDMHMLRWYVDVKEETVVMYSDDTGVSQENERLGTLIEEHPDRFVRVYPTSSDRDWRVMSQFIDEEVEDPVVQNRLREAIDGSGAFRRFKQVISEEGLKEQWYTYKERANREEAIRWLEANSLISGEKAEEFRASMENTGSDSTSEEDAFGPEQMTEGGVVICQRARDHKGLSEGAKYEILDERPGDNLIQIRDDRDNRKWYNKPLFEVEEPGRERKLDDLLMNIEVEKKGEHHAHARILFDQGGHWTVRVATPEWIDEQFDPEKTGAHMGIRKVVIVPSLDELAVNRSLTALDQEKNIASYAMKNV